MSELWYFAEGGETIGPIDLDALAQALKKKARPGDVLIWQEGYKDWVEAEAIPALDRFLVRPPPVPSKKSVSYLSPEHRQAQTTEEKQSGWKRWGATLLGWAIGFGLARVLGGVFWIPTLLIWVSYWAFTKIKLYMPVALMLAVVVGHTLWVMVGHVSLILLNKTSTELPLFAFDLIVVVTATIWCIKKESVSACVFVLLYELVVLAGNVIFFDEYAKNSELGASMHVALRVFGTGLAVYAIVKTLQRRENDQVTAD
jgi:GYF domain 2